MHVKIRQIDLFQYSNYLILILIITLFFTKEKSPAFSQINPIFPGLFLLIKNSVIIVVFVLELQKNVNLKKICQMAESITETEYCNLTYVPKGQIFREATKIWTSFHNFFDIT